MFHSNYLTMLFGFLPCLTFAQIGPDQHTLAMSILISLIVLYFIPYFIAFFRGHHNTMSIFILNLFLGWTCIGWLVCLVMSLQNRQRYIYR